MAEGVNYWTPKVIRLVRLIDYLGTLSKLFWDPGFNARIFGVNVSSYILIIFGSNRYRSFLGCGVFECENFLSVKLLLDSLLEVFFFRLEREGILSYCICSSKSRKLYSDGYLFSGRLL